jgi:hypothetical protein
MFTTDELINTNMIQRLCTLVAMKLFPNMESLKTESYLERASDESECFIIRKMQVKLSLRTIFSECG